MDVKLYKCEDEKLYYYNNSGIKIKCNGDVNIDSYSYYLNEIEQLKKENKDLRRNLAFLNTRVNNLIAEKQIEKYNETKSNN